MVNYRFKLLASLSSEKLINVPQGATAGQVKEAVKREFKLNPALRVKLMFTGRSLEDDFEWDRLIIDPKRDVITVVTVNPN